MGLVCIVRTLGQKHKKAREKNKKKTTLDCEDVFLLTMGKNHPAEAPAYPFGRTGKNKVKEQ